MLDAALFDATPSPGSWKYEPMTVAEIDAHPDADRIWATIKEIRGLAEARADAAIEAAEDDARDEGIAEGESNEREFCREKLNEAIDDALENPGPLAAVLEKMRDLL